MLIHSLLFSYLIFIQVEWLTTPVIPNEIFDLIPAKIELLQLKWKMSCLVLSTWTAVLHKGLLYHHYCMLFIEHTEHGLFAGDTALWTSSSTISNLSARLQQSIDAFENWCKSWKLKFQPTKTEMIHFTIHPRKKYKTFSGSQSRRHNHQTTRCNEILGSYHWQTAEMEKSSPTYWIQNGYTRRSSTLSSERS